MSAPIFRLEQISRLPAPSDNAAIATRRLETGTEIRSERAIFVLANTVLEGHRFAIKQISAGAPLLSWGYSFGIALSDIAPGGYLCNQSMLEALATRRLDGAVLPTQPNFSDLLAPFSLDEKSFRPGTRVEPVPSSGSFSGFRRPGKRGVGTRNYIVILGTTSRTASFARQLAARLQPTALLRPNLDGIVAVAHTEGGGNSEPHNATEVLRALAGFIVHPNVGAVLAVDYGVEPISNARLRAFMVEQGYPLADVPHQFLTLRGGLSGSLSEGERIVRGWLPAAMAQERSVEPLSGLQIALQCGGSDAFSGVSGNPLAGAVVHELIRHGGCAVMTETDEAVGAEAYLLNNVRDLATARAFLSEVDQFKEYLSWHGVTAESNPSGGNKIRGLYNIALKSLGAVHKKDPRTRLENVIGYARPLRELSYPGFTFMNGPGNDLEGVAGQIAAGCNLVLFVTGNGSVTNFPFVPTLKITTTTRRHNLLSQEMDINAGRYLDGESIESLTSDAFALMLQTASGRRTRGEHAGHSQVSLWRNWPQSGPVDISALRQPCIPSGLPLRHAVNYPLHTKAAPLRLFRTETGFATERIGLVLPTSLCSSQIARLAAERLNQKLRGGTPGLTRFEALAHTEGCGASGDSLFRLLGRSYRGYLTHPNVAAALLLEHGCEKTTNDLMREELTAAGVSADRFGWASVQMDGGIAKALDKIETWFVEKLATLPAPLSVPANLGALSVGLMTANKVSDVAAAAFASTVQSIVEAGGSVLIPQTDSLLGNPDFCAATLGSILPQPTLAYGQPVQEPGFHIIATETDHWVENLTGIGGCGAHLILSLVEGHSRQAHPLLPVIQIAEASQRSVIAAEDIDLFLTGDPTKDSSLIEQILVSVAELKRTPVANWRGLVDFQFTRGLLGVTS
ncbi:MAG TPA: UxaA family hydrolase [Patescibacteria group bacterium]|nr:UxaA family hydrolase [Patescibacteria group bacterium]